MLFGLPATLQSLVLNLLWSTAPIEPNSIPITFQLRHQHAVTNTSRIIFSDFKPGVSFSGSETQFSVPTRNFRVPRPYTFTALDGAHTLGWQDWEIPTPDVTKRSTLLQLGSMAFNTYAADNSTASEWYEISDEWSSTPYGWDPQADGMRGHVFVSTDNTTVVIAIKGTSAGWMVGGGGPTVGKDKKNDNLLFSCCCARVGPTWSTVCDCYDGGYRCDTDCVEEAMKDEGLFYPIGLVGRYSIVTTMCSLSSQNLYNNVTYMYPNANIWLTGHSLGGGLAALMGTTFGAPVVAFEAPAERLASQRLHLPRPVRSFPLQTDSVLTPISSLASRRQTTSHMYTTPLTLFQWVPVQASHPCAPLADSLSRPGVTSAKSSCTTPCRSSTGRSTSATMASSWLSTKY